MEYGAAFLHSPVMASPDNFVIQYKNRADWNTAFIQTLPGFFNGGLHKLICHHIFLRNSTKQNVQKNIVTGDDGLFLIAAVPALPDGSKYAIEGEE
jgi:hypothetical protein